MAAAPLGMESASRSLDNVTEMLWEDALRHLNSTNNEVLLPSNVTDIIGQGNLDKIKTRLCDLIGAPVVAFVDESIDALRIMRTPAFSGSAISVASHDTVSRRQFHAATDTTKQHEKPAAHGKTAKIPRPPNAFILYRQHHQPEIKATYPDFCNNDISILLGKQWRDESDAVKAHYKAQAEELKRKHARDHPDYQYSPRRPSEKKRRASSRQYPKHAKMLGRSESLSPPSTSAAGSHASTPVLPSGFNAQSASAVTSSTRGQNQIGEISVGGGADGAGDEMNVVLGADGVVSAFATGDQGAGLGLDADAFSAIMQQVTNGVTVSGSVGGSTVGNASISASASANGADGRYLMYQDLGHAGPGAEQAAVDSFEFSDFIADLY